MCPDQIPFAAPHAANETDGGSGDALLPQWIAGAASGDQRAASALVERFRPNVLRIVRARRPKRIAEEDLTQEVFMKIFARLGQYAGDAPFEHWVARIAVTTCVDHWRAQQRRPELRWADLLESEATWLEHVLADHGVPRPGDRLATNELLESLLSRLKPDDRRIIVLFELEQRSIAEICALTGWNFDFTKMRLFRVRRKLCRLWARMSEFHDGHANATPRWKGKAA